MRDPARALRENPVFRSLPDEACEALLARSEVRRYAAREPVLAEDEPPAWVYVVLSGSVRVYHCSAAGLQVTLKIFKPP
jgi:CRP-like cAMP-binding protein